MDRFQALKSTLFYAFFPAIFLYTTVVYSEGLFLFSILTAWYFYKKDKHLLSMIFTSIATISRPPGILILIPILIETLRKHSQGTALRRRNILYYAIPLFSFFSWLLYCRMTINDWFASFNRHGWDNLLSLRLFLFNMFSNEVPQFSEYNNQVWIFLLLAPILIHFLRRMDRSLALYSTIYFVGIVLFGALVSVPRFISFLFPIWLSLTLKLSQLKKSNLLTIMLCTTFYIMGLSLWNNFINGEFIF
jgi:Gpi18-like mannosyltransferase